MENVSNINPTNRYNGYNRYTYYLYITRYNETEAATGAWDLVQVNLSKFVKVWVDSWKVNMFGWIHVGWIRVGWIHVWV